MNQTEFKGKIPRCFASECFENAEAFAGIIHGQEFGYCKFHAYLLNELKQQNKRLRI